MYERIPAWVDSGHCLTNKQYYVPINKTDYWMCQRYPSYNFQITLNTYELVHLHLDDVFQLCYVNVRALYGRMNSVRPMHTFISDFIDMWL